MKFIEPHAGKIDKSNPTNSITILTFFFKCYILVLLSFYTKMKKKILFLEELKTKNKKNENGKKIVNYFINYLFML